MVTRLKSYFADGRLHAIALAEAGRMMLASFVKFATWAEVGALLLPLPLGRSQPGKRQAKMTDRKMRMVKRCGLCIGLLFESNASEHRIGLCD